MATETVNHAGNSGIGTKAERPAPLKQVSEWANHMAYAITEAAYQARAARALLHEYKGTDADEGLTGVSYLLQRLTNDLDALSRNVGDLSLHTFQREASHG